MSNSAFVLQDLFWETTLRCNAHCSFCGSNCGDKAGEALSTEDVLSAFKSVAEAYDARRIMINVTGGEPLLREDLFEVMAQCSGLGFSWGMVTNGMLVTEETIRKMKQSNMKTISISLDGLKEHHEELRGVKKSFERVVNTIKMLVAADFLEHVQVTTVVTQKNIEDLDELYQFLRTLGIHSWRVAIVDGIGRATGKEDLLLKAEHLKQYMEFISSHSRDEILPVVTSCSHYLGNHDSDLGRSPFFCGTGIHVASILANGDIYVCPNVPRRPELIQGNIKTDNFVDVWENGFEYFRNADNRKSHQCENCVDWPNCLGDSMHTWDFDKRNPSFCYRTYFPEEKMAENLNMDFVIAELKKQYVQLRGVKYSYKNSIKEQLVFTPNAAEEMYRFFHWGTHHPLNMSEQMMCLIGHKFSDCTVVEFASPVFLEKRSSVMAAFSERSFQSAKEELYAVNRYYRSPECKQYQLVDASCELLGFIHSHPAELDLCPSEPDVELHTTLFKEKGIGWNIIINPQKKQLAAYSGKNMKLSEMIFLVEAENVGLWK